MNIIWKFSLIVKYTIKTYESLYKTYVKMLYQLSNKKNIEEQLMQYVYTKYNIYSNISVN